MKNIARISALAAFAATTFMAQAQNKQPFYYTVSISGISPAEVPIQAFSWGMSIPFSWHSGGGGGTGLPNFSSIAIQRVFNNTTAPLFGAGVAGQQFSSVRLRGYAKDVAAPFLDMRFFDARLESQALSGSDGNLPSESITFNYTKIEINGFMYDLQSNTSAQNMQMREFVASLIAKASTAPAK